nr:winged helix DNA-binding domain-containing protein [Salsipaludibacter albus]
MVGLHGTDPVAVFLQVRARVPGVAADAVEHALYDARTVVRVLAMRRTMFVVDPVDMPMLKAAVTDRLGAAELRRTAKWIEEADLARDGQAWVRAAAVDTVATLAEHGPMTALDLRAHVPALAEQIVLGRGKPWEGKVGMSTRVLFWLATTGRIVRGRPGGSIASTNWEWALTEDWLGDDAPGLDESDDPERADAAVALARRYLAAFGPATFDDVQWWTGWTKTLTRAALAAIGPDVVMVQDGLGGTTEALVLPGDGAPPDPATAEESPVVALLPALDATPMGWKQRGFCLGTRTGFPSAFFDRNGNIGPTVWADGRVVGAWTQRADGEIAWRLVDDHGIDEAAVAVQAAAVAEWLGDLRFTPRFPTPWQVELQSA